MVVTVLANNLDAQSVLLQVVEILSELHLKIVPTGVRELPVYTLVLDCWMQTQKSVLHSNHPQRDNSDMSEEQHLHHCEDASARISHESRKQLLRGSRAGHITARWCAILVR